MAPAEVWKGQRTSSPRAFVDVACAAELLQVSEATVRRRCRRGLLPAIRIGREWQVELAGVQAAQSSSIPKPRYS